MATYTRAQVEEKAKEIGLSNSQLSQIIAEEYANFEAEGLDGMPGVDKHSVVYGWALFSMETF